MTAVYARKKIAYLDRGKNEKNLSQKKKREGV